MSWFDYIKEHPDKNWVDYYEISQNPNITWDIIEANPDKPWQYGVVDRNPNITWDIVEANLDKPWRYDWLAKNQMSKHPHFQNRQLSYVFK